MMDSRGQNLTVEQMFLFTIGLLITISIFMSFRVISSHVTGLSEDDQLNEVGALVLTGIQRVSAGLENGGTAALTLDIPKSISRLEYTITLDGRELSVTLPTGKNAMMGLEGTGASYLVSGRATSSTGRISIIGVREDRTIRLVRA